MDSVVDKGQSDELRSGMGPSWAVRKTRSLLDAPAFGDSPNLLDAVREVSLVLMGDAQQGIQHQQYTHLRNHGGGISVVDRGVEPHEMLNTAETRRRLRGKLEANALECAKAVLQTYEQVHEKLVAVQGEFEGMRSDLDRISRRLVDARQGASVVVDQTSELRKRLSTSEKKAKVTQLFARRFTLMPEELASLQASHITRAFLDAIRKLERIHADSKILLKLRNQRVGLEILEFATSKREEAYEKLYKFVQQEFGTMKAESAQENPEQESALLRDAIIALRGRPTLLQYCAEEVASARRHALVEQFVAALTKGGPGGVPKPIEIHAHDAMRYTNDMLAWIHQTLASERELINRLFGDGPAEEDEQMDNREQLSRKVLNTMFDSLCRPFRVRFEQALEPLPPVVSLYKLASLLEFYATTMGKYLGDDSALPTTLLECNSVAMYAFFSSWKSKMESFQASQVAPEDLSPPLAVQQSMSRLNEIMLTLDASISPTDVREGQVHAVLEVILTPLIRLCEKSSRNLSAMDRLIFLANCLDSMRSPLVPYSFAQPRLEELFRQADSYIDQYIESALGSVLKRCGLQDRLRMLTESPDQEGMAMVKRPGMDLVALSIAMKNFYVILFGGDVVGEADALSPPKVNLIINTRMRNRAKSAVAEGIANAHAQLHAAILDPRNGYGPDAAVAVGLRDPRKVSLVLNGRL
mmetsp:Transcript_18339/g.38318  ORF Transcript_18339/g.38318 Transcript_18339/m.38318 type:complete len:698 (-) Transcript_18339:1431-3524(-)